MTNNSALCKDDAGKAVSTITAFFSFCNQVKGGYRLNYKTSLFCGTFHFNKLYSIFLNPVWEFY